MKARQKRKNASHETTPVRSRSELVTRSLSHLNRSLRQFSDGFQSRMWTLQEHLLVEPLESAAWVVSQRVRKVQSHVFDFIDDKISRIDDARHRKLDHQTALERFDGEGGTMLPTSAEEASEEELGKISTAGKGNGNGKANGKSDARFEASPPH
jgi:hypothetical protein